MTTWPWVLMALCGAVAWPVLAIGLFPGVMRAVEGQPDNFLVVCLDPGTGAPVVVEYGQEQGRKCFLGPLTDGWRRTAPGHVETAELGVMVGDLRHFEAGIENLGTTPHHFWFRCPDETPLPVLSWRSEFPFVLIPGYGWLTLALGWLVWMSGIVGTRLLVGQLRARGNRKIGGAP